MVHCEMQQTLQMLCETQPYLTSEFLEPDVFWLLVTVDVGLVIYHTHGVPDDQSNHEVLVNC